MSRGRKLHQRPDAFDEAPFELDPGFDRKRTGLAEGEIRALVRDLKAGAPWEEATKHLVNDVRPEVLEGWRAELERRASSAPRAVIPDRPLVPAPEGSAALAKLSAARADASETLDRAMRETELLQAAVARAEAAVRIAQATAARQRSPEARRGLVEARKSLRDARARLADAEERSDNAAADVANLADEIASSEAAHGANRRQVLLERINAWARENDSRVLDDLAAILALGVAKFGLYGDVATVLTGHFGARLAADAMRPRVRAAEERFLRQDSTQEPAGDQQAARARTRRRTEV